MPPRITVVGSVNMDLVLSCRHLPRPGETTAATSSIEIPGGKGANQAVAAAKLGAEVSMIGRVGDDAFGPQLLVNLREQAVNCEHVRTCRNTASGIAIVAVDEAGENSIILSPAANNLVSVADVEESRAVIENADLLLVQLEVPTETVAAAMNIAKVAGVKTVFDPAPAPQSWPGPIAVADIICPNEMEAAAMTGMPIDNIEHAFAAAHVLSSQTEGTVIVTLGADGAIFSCPDGSQQHLPANPIEVVDSTGSGDAFAAAFAVRWAETSDVADSVRFANTAGALAATKLGAQSGMATRAELESIGLNADS